MWGSHIDHIIDGIMWVSSDCLIVMLIRVNGSAWFRIHGYIEDLFETKKG